MDVKSLRPLERKYLDDSRTVDIVKKFTPALLALAQDNKLVRRAAFQIQAIDELKQNINLDPPRTQFLSQVLGRTYAELEVLHSDPKIAEFIQNNFSLAHEMLLTAPAGSNQEYLAMTVLEAMSALNKGNYGIGSVYMLKSGSKEYIISGQNSLFTEGYPHSHAEHNGMKHVVNLAHGSIQEVDKIIAIRERTDGETDTRSEIATSLEPCPMCMLGMLNHEGQTGKDFKKVIIGAKDDHGAFWLDNPLAKLPAVWRNILKSTGLKIDLADFTGDRKERSSFINEMVKKLWKHLGRGNGVEILDIYDSPEIDLKYKDLMFRVFLDTRDDIDRALRAGATKVVDLKEAASNANTHYPFSN